MSKAVGSRSASDTTGVSNEHPLVRWSLWLAGGVVFGLGLGFLLGLARPRPRATM